ncbi:LysR substrate-binding domain-containing protein [Niveispirillum sp. KHB5.9]|uniref:LysR substrate-binding domain-containing protein n=1 Tax=Niveispirillum sp. KHB5.9 TaxID=3400269 RepID=UPI003A89EFE0
MRLTHLRHFTAVAERGSLRAAARQLGIAQPALTRSIQEMEHELGVSLFERLPRGVALTPMGQAFLRRAAAVQNELRLATDEIAQLRGNMTGQVTIELSSAVQMALLPRVIAPFRRKFPDVYLTLREGAFPTAEGPLLEGAIDFYVGPMPDIPQGGELVAEKLFDNTRLVYGRKGHPRAGARFLHELADAGWIRTQVSVDPSSELTNIFQQHGLAPPRVEMTGASTMAIILVVAHSDLLTMLPKQWMEFVATRELLQPIPIAELLPAPPICIVNRARLPLTPAAQFLADLFRRAAGYQMRDETRVAGL